jgi:c-di-GMP-binding flagellar brake protein YcgR
MADRRRREDAEATPAADRRKTPRREAARMPVSLWAVEDDGSGIYYHHVRDLSAGGLFLEKGLTLPVGSRMQLELTLPTARSIRAEGVVVTSVSIEGAERAKSANERGANKTSGNGIRFEKISDADRKAIEDYVLSAAK